jgi:hypothetical protein
VTIGLARPRARDIRSSAEFAAYEAELRAHIEEQHA